MRDSMCANDGLMEENGILHQGELILEKHEGINSIRIYRFMDSTDPKEFFWESSPKILFIKCPECDDSIFLWDKDDEGEEEQHFEGCTYDKEILGNELTELHKNNNDWEWSEIYYSKEAAFLRIFEFMRNKKNEIYKKFHDFTYRKEDKLRDKYNSGPQYKKNIAHIIQCLANEELH